MNKINVTVGEKIELIAGSRRWVEGTDRYLDIGCVGAVVEVHLPQRGLGDIEDIDGDVIHDADRDGYAVVAFPTWLPQRILIWPRDENTRWRKPADDRTEVERKEIAPMTSKLVFDKTTLMSVKVGSALLRAIAENGAPNSFSFSELVGAKDAMFAGKAVRKQWIPFCLNFASRLPAEFKDARVNLSGGRLHVERSPRCEKCGRRYGREPSTGLRLCPCGATVPANS